MKQANFVLYFFLAAVLVATLTGCPGPGPDHDAGPLPMGDAGPDSDVPDAGPDSEVLPDGGTDDLGQDGGTVDPCVDPEYVGRECNLPEGVVYSRDAFLCASAIDWDLWITDVPGASPRGENSNEVGGVLYAYLHFANGNPAMFRPAGMISSFTCGPEGACWYSWRNPANIYGHCRVDFATDCSTATITCWTPTSPSGIVSQAFYVGPQT